MSLCRPNTDSVGLHGICSSRVRGESQEELNNSVRYHFSYPGEALNADLKIKHATADGQIAFRPFWTNLNGICWW